MRKRIGLGLAAITASLLALACAVSPLPAQEKAKSTPPKFVYGHDLRVRPGSASDFDSKTPRIGVEVFQDSGTGASIGITDVGSIAVSPIAPLGMKKDCEWLTGLTLNARRAGEAEFTQKTQKFGVELFKDLAANRLLYVCQTGSLAFASLPTNWSMDKGPKWHHALEPKVREPEQETFEKAKKYGLEVFKDESTGGLIYITEIGAIATAPAPATVPDKSKIAPPKPLYGLVLRVRKSDEPNFSEQTKKVGIEVFEDANANTLFYLSQTGFIAVVPNSGKLLDGKGVTWKAAMSLSARKAGEKEFEKATKFGVEVFQDNKTGNLIFVSETGSIAVLPK